MRAHQFIVEDSDRTDYVIYVNDKPATVYPTREAAQRDLDAVKKKHPGDKIEIKRRVRSEKIDEDAGSSPGGVSPNTKMVCEKDEPQPYIKTWTDRNGIKHWEVYDWQDAFQQRFSSKQAAQEWLDAHWNKLSESLSDYYNPGYPKRSARLIAKHYFLGDQALLRKEPQLKKDYNGYYLPQYDTDSNKWLLNFKRLCNNYKHIQTRNIQGAQLNQIKNYGTTTTSESTNDVVKKNSAISDTDRKVDRFFVDSTFPKSNTDGYDLITLRKFQSQLNSSIRRVTSNPEVASVIRQYYYTGDLNYQDIQNPTNKKIYTIQKAYVYKQRGLINSYPRNMAPLLSAVLYLDQNDKTSLINIQDKD